MKYPTRQWLLTGELPRESAIAAIRNAPADPTTPLEIVLRVPVKARKPDQNSLMWAGPLADIAEQGWVQGRQYSAEV